MSLNREWKTNIKIINVGVLIFLTMSMSMPKSLSGCHVGCTNKSQLSPDSFRNPRFSFEDRDASTHIDFSWPPIYITTSASAISCLNQVKAGQYMQ